MRPERWQRIEALFHQASELSGTAREKLLDRECAGDDELRREVTTLLLAEESAGDAIGGAIRTAAAESMAAKPASQRLGPYEILRELGRGGMGAVYLARRADDAFEQQVAIKLIRGGLAGADQITRFRTERQILADLDHRSIARLLDGGTTADGLPYLVMEYVEGEPIDHWCAARELSIGARLDLFLEVCDAVRYAHQNLVVHRDIKPSNILVADSAVPKLLDFGIAKLIGANDQELTRSVERLLTPDYASPEQVRGGPITTRTDVYALGLLLYILLTDQRPYRFGKASPQEIERVVCDLEPTRPSEVARGDGEKEEYAGSASGTRWRRTGRRRKELSGDLDNIVLKALRKEPELRYPGVGELMEDIRRHLEGQPVRARPATVGYQLQKFVGRHRSSLVAAAAAVVLLAALTTFHLTRVTRERDRAQSEAAKAEQVASFLGSLFEVADPAESLGETITARQLLDAGAERIRRELADQPVVRAEMMTVVGNVSRKVGDHERAIELLEEALDSRRVLYGPSHPEVASSQHDLATALHVSGDLERAEALFRQSLELHRELYGEVHPQTVSAVSALGSLLQDRGRLEDSEALARQAIDLNARLPSAARHEPSSLHNNLGRVLHERGDLAAGERELRRSLELRRQLHGELHPDVDVAMGNLAILLRDRGKYEEAERLYLKSLGISRQLYGDEHPQVALRLNNLAGFYKTLGRAEQAEGLQREALELFRQSFGEEHPRVAMSLNNLANLLHDQGRLDEAHQFHLEAVELNRRLYGDSHPHVAGTLNNLAVLLRDMGDLEAAEPLHRKALAIDRELLGDRHPYVASDLDSLAALLMAKGDYGAAEALLEESLGIKLTVLEENHPDTAQTLALRGRQLLETDRAGEAEPVLRQALEIRRRTLPEDHLDIAVSESLLGLCLMERGDLAAGSALLESGERRLHGRQDRYREDARRARAGLERLEELSAGSGSG